MKLIANSSVAFTHLIAEYSGYRVLIQSIFNSRDLHQQLTQNLQALNNQAELWSYQISHNEIDGVLKLLGINLSASISGDWLIDYMKFLSKSQAGRITSSPTKSKSNLMPQSITAELKEHVLIHFDRFKHLVVLVCLSPSLERCGLYFLSNSENRRSMNGNYIKEVSESLKSIFSRIATLYMDKYKKYLC